MHERIQRLKDRILIACEKAKRDPKSVKILAVSKSQAAQAVESAYQNGFLDFGENYAQEMSVKINSPVLKDLDLNWHFIGHIQSNKLRQISAARFVHTLSEVKHAQMLCEILGAKKTMNACLQVSLNGEGQRSGVSPEALLSNYLAIKKMPNINLCGLMTIAPINTGHPPKYWLQKMQQLKNDLEQAIGEPIAELSMGMSSDFEDAIMFGATWIRVGTLIFGERNSTKH